MSNILTRAQLEMIVMGGFGNVADKMIADVIRSRERQARKKYGKLSLHNQTWQRMKHSLGVVRKSYSIGVVNS